MTDRAAALELLRLALGDAAAEFRDGQWEAIDALVNRRERRLVVQRTGWGKSYVYFISTRILRDRGRGPTLIVSPLLALMRNQIEAAERLGVRARTVNSTNRDDWPGIERVVRRNEVDALLVSPERLANEEFVEKVLLPIAERIGLLVVDEAHCISDWGHDFRPDYRRLVNILQRMPANVPILGTTATANNRVIEDVHNQLGDIGIQRGSLMRSTLALQTVQLPTQAARLAWLAEHVSALPGTGIVYTLTKRDAKQVADWLQLHGIEARAYFSGVVGDGFQDSDAYRQHLERKLLNNEIKALVATTALGMGYDKPDLGFVVHYQAPGSIVAYYQQVGRAGRAIDHAVGVLMSGEEDSHIHDYFRKSAFPKERWVLAILAALEESDGLSVLQLEEAVNLRRGQIEQVLKFLSVENPAPVLKSGSTWQRTPVPYRMDHEKIERLTGQRDTEWEEVMSYVAVESCLMEFLAESLDDAGPQPCGKCAKCLGRPIVDPDFTREMAISAARYLRHAELELECNKQVARDALREYGLSGNIPAALRAETGRILSRWGDAGWGQLVAADKHAGYFRDELVHAVVEMLNDRWRPTPRPAWVTCVPSLNNPTLDSRLRPLFGCGNKTLLNKGGVAVVGSRDADQADLNFSASLARAAANQGLSVISGGARGVDESAMLGALESEGTSVGVLADSVLRAATSAKYRKHLLADDLVLVSPFNPEAGFNVGNAMARNKHIYCLSDAAVVVNSTPDEGGTWNGAIEDLKSEWVPLWVQPKHDPASGNATLVQKGARWFSRDVPALSTLWEMAVGGDAAPEAAGFPLLQSETVNAPAEAATTPTKATSAESEDGAADAPPPGSPIAKADADYSSSEPASDFYSLFLLRLRELTDGDPMNVEDIAARLELEKAQVNAWLKRGTTDGQIKKLSKPVRYQSASADQRQASFFINEI